MDEEQVVPLWISGILFRHVLRDALEHLFGVFRSTGLETDSYTSMDLQAALAMGISWNTVSPWCGTVCLWILQCDADLHRTRPDHHGPVQTS